MPTRIPLRPSLLSRRRQSVKWIILHHTAEMYENPESRIDNSKFQMPGLIKGVLEKKQGDINYNYVIDMIKNDYNVITARPFVYLCDFEDIDPSINNRSIHIGLLGNYSFKVPESRMYQILAYKILTPLLRQHALSPSRIKLHREVSNEDIECPGDFIDRGRLMSQVKRFLIK